MEESLGIVIGFIGIIFVLAIIGVFIYFYYRIQELLNQVQEHNRTLSPGMVWLILIPCFNIIWRFILVDRVSESLRNEFDERGIPHKEPKPSNTKGMLMAGFGAAGAIPYLGILFALVSIVFWILYWVEIEEHMKTLKFGKSQIDTLDNPTLFLEE